MRASTSDPAGARSGLASIEADETRYPKSKNSVNASRTLA